MDNPFIHGEPVPPEDRAGLADREEELDLLVRSMLGGRNVIVIAPRRYGKTSLLKRAVVEVRAKGGRSGWVSLGDCASPRDVAEAILAGVLSGPASWSQRMSAALRRRVEALGATIRLRPASGDTEAEIAVSLRPSAGGWRETVADVLRTLRDAGEDAAPVSLVIDEFQTAHELDPALPAVVKRLTDELRGVSLVLSGSRRHLMTQLTSGKAAPLARIGTTIALPKVPREEMVDFLMRRASAGGKMLADGVAEMIHDVAAGVPNEVQQLAWLTFEISPRRIQASAVETARSLLLRQARFEFEAIFAHVSPSARRVLKVLATEEPITSLASRAMVDRVEVANASGVMKAVRALEREDLIELSPDGWRIANPFFKIWLAEHAGRE